MSWARGSPTASSTGTTFSILFLSLKHYLFYRGTSRLCLFSHQELALSSTVVIGNKNSSSGGPTTLWELVRYFLYLGTFGFGGPIALVGYMQKDLVEKRKWIEKQDYREGLALAQLAPGPRPAQLPISPGSAGGKIGGARVVGIAFIAPSFLMV